MRETHSPIISAALHINNLTKSYGDNIALSSISFAVDPGARVGLLGPNGAGKSTCLKIIAGILRPDNGELHLGDLSMKENPREIKKLLGYIPEDPHFFPYLTGEEHINLSRSFRGLNRRSHTDRVHELTERLELREVLGRPVAQYSHGMRQKLAFLMALYHDPALLIVDEPMVGLDIYAQVTVKELLLAESVRGKAILISTHTLPLVSEIATDTVVLDRGIVVARGTPAELAEEDDLERFFTRLRASEEAS